MKSLVAKSLLVLLAISAIYLGLLYTDQQQARKLATTYSRLTSIQEPLLQNHLSLSQIPALNVDNPEFEVEQDRLLSSLTHSREQAHEAAKDHVLSRDATYSQLLEDTRVFLAQQEDFLNSYQPNSEATAEYLNKQKDLLISYNQELADLKQDLVPYIQR